MDTTQTNWKNLLFTIFYHLVALVGVPLYIVFMNESWMLIFASLVLVFLSGVSITAGYHRLYSHRAYNASKGVEAVLLFFGTMAFQGSVFQWAHKHRLHHQHTDKEEDPHSIAVGFWHAHMGWMFKKHIPVDLKLIPDLAQNKLLQFQNRYYTPLAILFSVIVFFALGFLFNDFVGAFVAGFGLRVFVLNNCTFFINSLAHTWGSKSYARELSAVDNFIMAFLTFGEGYHNYHHAFPSDYRNGIRWYHFDPTKWIISVLGKLGWAYELRKMDQSAIHRKIILEDKKMFLDVLKERMVEKRDELEAKVNSLSDQLCAKFSELKQKRDALRQAKMNAVKEDIRQLKATIKSLKRSIKQDWNSWIELSRQVTAGLGKGHAH
jgi:stearoyl-CoA desaturase (Delta-9 desaturase)